MTRAKPSYADRAPTALSRPVIGAVLFACNLNAVRSPMAAALTRARYGDAIFVDSVGVCAGAGEVDAFAAEVMRERGLDLSAHHAKTFADIDPGVFDLIVALTPEARDEAARLIGDWAVDVEYWPIPNPSEARGGRDQILDAFRAVRDAIDAQIATRFSAASDG